MSNEKNKILVFAVLCMLALLFICCENPWEKKLLDPLFKDFQFAYNIGDPGPGRGIIFYRSAAPFYMTDNGQECHYLEAAPVDQGTSLLWSSGAAFDNTDIFGTSTAIGTGRENTALILTVDPSAPAAHACNIYFTPTTSPGDWFLPSLGELNEMYKQKPLFGITTNGFWSSSQRFNTHAWFIQNDVQSGTYKDEGWYVRAVRAF